MNTTLSLLKCSVDAVEGIKKLQRYVQLGFTEIMVVNSSPDRKKLVKLLAQQISPAFKAEQ